MSSSGLIFFIFNEYIVSQIAQSFEISITYTKIFHQVDFSLVLYYKTVILKE